MGTLRAISIGTAVPRGDFDGVVHSLFDTAANLCPGRDAGLLTLVPANGPDLPQGIRLGTPPNYSFEGKLNVGEKMTCRGGSLRAEHDRLVIELRGAKRWRCKLPSIDINEPCATTGWTAVMEALVERQRRTGVESLFTEALQADLPRRSAATWTLETHIRELVEAACHLEQPSEAAIAGLIGLGEGLTPAGDDLLVGFLTGLRCTAGANRKRRAFLSAVGKTIVWLSYLTNDISRTYLVHAARGQVSQPLEDLAEAIARGEERCKLLLIAEEAMRLGHSSGMETVTGLLVGLACWGKGVASSEKIFFH